MDKFTHLGEFLAYLFDEDRAVEKAHSCRLSEIAREMAGNETANYKCIQRFVAEESLKSILLRL